MLLTTPFYIQSLWEAVLPSIYLSSSSLTFSPWALIVGNEGHNYLIVTFLNGAKCHRDIYPQTHFFALNAHLVCSYVLIRAINPGILFPSSCVLPPLWQLTVTAPAL